MAPLCGAGSPAKIRQTEHPPSPRKGTSGPVASCILPPPARGASVPCRATTPGPQNAGTTPSLCVPWADIQREHMKNALRRHILLSPVVKSPLQRALPFVVGRKRGCAVASKGRNRFPSPYSAQSLGECEEVALRKRTRAPDLTPLPLTYCQPSQSIASPHPRAVPRPASQHLRTHILERSLPTQSKPHLTEDLG